MAAQRLTVDDIACRLETLPHWRLHEEKLHRSLRFDDFSEAFAFMARVAMAAEQLNHHPEWQNVWNQVDIALTTHDAGGISELDFELVRRIEAILA